MNETPQQEPYYEDEQLDCFDCGQKFTFTGGERKFFEKNGFVKPRRCKPCRSKNKAKKERNERTD